MNIVFINNKFIDIKKAHISCLDRGFLHGEGIYEILLIYNKKPIDLENHITRFKKSVELSNIVQTENLSNNYNAFLKNIKDIIYELVNINDISIGSLRFQVTSSEDGIDNIFASIQEAEVNSIDNIRTIKAITMNDIRWKMSNIKSTSLIIRKIIDKQLEEKNVDDVIFFQDEYITESTKSNIFIVDTKNNIITTPANEKIIHGITRQRLINIVNSSHGSLKKVLEKEITLDELMQAKEVFFTSSVKLFSSVVEINNKIIGSGKVGPMTNHLYGRYLDFLSYQE